MKRLKDFSLQNKRVLVRVDLNVPMFDDHVTSDARILAVLPTINFILEQGGAVILMSHLGRPKEGTFDPAFSLEPVAARLSERLVKVVQFERDWLDGIEIRSGEVALCENVRFNVGEKANDENLGRKMAALCDLFVMDAFATAHRAQASTHAVAKFAAESCAGPLLVHELEVLSQVKHQAKKPVLAIVGGKKVSSKLGLLESLIDWVDVLIVGGGIANTFIAAKGFDVGQSLYQPEMVQQAKALMQKAESKGVKIPLPIDVIVGAKISPDVETKVETIAAIGSRDVIGDIGPKTSQVFSDLIGAAKTILWNGPVGVFELKPFSQGTEKMTAAIAKSDAFSLAGGGDTIAAIETYQAENRISAISTGGGAFLEYFEEKKLPAVEILEHCA